MDSGMADMGIAVTIFGHILLTRKPQSAIIRPEFVYEVPHCLQNPRRISPMAVQHPELTTEQWNFLAFLDAFGGPVSIDLAVSIAPLPHAALLDLVERGVKTGLIQREGTTDLKIANTLNAFVRAELKALNTPMQIASWLERLEASGMIDGLDPSDLVPLYLRDGNEKKASEMEMALGIEAVRCGRQEAAIGFLKKALGRLSQIVGDTKFESGVVSATLEYSDLCFAMGRDFNILPAFLERASQAAVRVGDNRSSAMINFHLGRVLYFANQRAHALIVFSQGEKSIKELGDFDILVRSAEFLGLYYFMQGLPKKAIEHFERAVQDMESRGKSPHINSTTIIFIGYCAVYLGQFHKAIGFLDYHWHLALEKSDLSQAATIRAVLGTILVLIGRTTEGVYHLTRAEKDATDLDNKFALYLTKGGLGYCEFFRGNIQKAWQLMAAIFSEGKNFGVVNQYASPFVIEMVSEFKRLGYEDLPAMPFQKEVNRLMTDPDIHLRGVVLRLQARLAGESGGDKEKISADLKASEAYLKRSEDPVQLAMTWLEMARLKLAENKPEEASLLTKKARLGLAGFGDKFFPDDLRHLLEDDLGMSPAISVSREEIISRFLDMMEALFPTNPDEDLLNSTIAATNRLFQAERGGIFRVEDGKPELQVACNLNAVEVGSADFKLSLRIIRRVAQTGEPVIIRSTSTDPDLTGHRLKAILCLPIEVNGRVSGVLYHDNSYLDDCFDFLDRTLAQKLTFQITNYIKRVRRFSRQLEQAKNINANPVGKGESEEIELLTESSAMLQVLNQADIVAGSEGTVLISGETGVGKELLAKRIHLASPRRKGPFIVVDMTTIPENLVESELFGHEKGAFTGADRQLRGRFELANGGTLFIDEIGEAPRPVQARLLRAIQEKSFYRVGGTRETKSDFRLVAATNRNLEQDVIAGRFREDLFYRLNVMPLTIPPLRERKKDIILLADYFLDIFAGKYNYPKPSLSSQDEKSLAEYGWSGNVRELKNMMERAVVMSNMGQFELALPASRGSLKGDIIADNPSFDELQRRYFSVVLEKTGGKISGRGGAAEWLKMPRTTLNARLKKLGLR
jgi:transcriptional regulator with GAF, ATPase, and Fis domain/tetratricopeptide (TPR) repeat protein